MREHPKGFEPPRFAPGDRIWLCRDLGSVNDDRYANVGRIKLFSGTVHKVITEKRQFATEKGTEDYYRLVEYIVTLDNGDEVTYEASFCYKSPREFLHYVMGENLIDNLFLSGQDN